LLWTCYWRPCFWASKISNLGSSFLSLLSAGITGVHLKKINRLYTFEEKGSALFFSRYLIACLLTGECQSPPARFDQPKLMLSCAPCCLLSRFLTDVRVLRWCQHTG
jgi:hypothetical protein